MESSEIVLLDLFSGTGGFAKGLMEAGFSFSKHYFSEIDKYAIANYSYNFKNAIHVGAIQEIQKETLQKPDLICFGSPCQDLSIAGKQKGLKGSRSRLFFDAVNILDHYRPRMFIFENVKGLFSSNQGKDFEVVLRSFANLGVYDLQWQLLNTAWFLPQNRERIYIVGTLRGQPRPQVFPFPENYQKATQGIKKTLTKARITPTIDTKVGDYGNYAPYIFTTRKRGKEQQLEFRKDTNVNCITGAKKSNYIANWKPTTYTRSEKAKQIRKANQKKGIDSHPFQEKELTLRKQDISGTITANMSTDNLLTNSTNIRRLTPLECERLQGFPDYWTKYGILDEQTIELSDSRRYHLLGNAVSVPIVKAIAHRLLPVFSSSSKTITTMNAPLNGLGKPGKTPVTYYGGKQNLVRRILSLIPKHNLYCEPFVGGAAVFFAKEPSLVEVINDLDGHVVNFYQVCKTKFRALQKKIQATPHSRKVHAQAAAILKNPKEKDPVKKAWALWVQTNMSFSSRMFGGYAYERKSNGVSKAIHNKRMEFTKDICERLNLVDIECNDALKVIQSRDTPESFFYVDPPYFNSDMGHYGGYTEQDFKNLLEVLSQIEGKFLLSSYPSAILEQFKTKYRWKQQSIAQIVSVTRGRRDKKKTEVFTANYDLKDMVSLEGVVAEEFIQLKAKALQLQLSLS